MNRITPFVLLVSCLALTSPVFPQVKMAGPAPLFSGPAAYDVSPPLSSIPPFPEGFQPDTGNIIKEMDREPTEYVLPETGVDPVWQRTGGVNATRSPFINFAGLRNNQNGGRVVPPDTDGDIGPDHYFQDVNVIYQIFDRQGNSLYGPANIANIWSGFNGGWTGKPLSDPIVLYDEQADRWFVSIFTTTTDGSGNYYILIAVSQTASPTGSYYRYAYAWSTKPDYAKYGIWPDGYYMGCNTGGQDIAVFERSQILTGGSADVVTFDNPNRPQSGFHAVQPVDCDGSFPSSGTPCYFITINDNAWPGGAGDELRIWELDVDWGNMANSTWTWVQTLSVASFSASFDGGWENIPQPGTAQKLDAIAEVLMYRAQYRIVSGTPHIVCCHTVDVDGSDHAGIRWYDLTRSGGSWSKNHESTYAPDAHHRWMGSIAINASGDIALGYSVSSGTVYPSIRFTGRKNGDAANTMTFAEMNIFAGSTSQTDAERWGDYSKMSVDPNDDFTFWYTQEYVGTYGGWCPWDSRVASFMLDCAVKVTTQDEYISNVNCGSINNSSGWSSGGYGDYRHISTTMAKGSPYPITVSIGNSYSGDRGAIWVDWNDDGDYVDANEAIAPISGSPGGGPYTATIIPPLSTANGPKTMRVRLNWDADPPPCGTTTYGEVEDYTVVVGNPTPNIWLGGYSNLWSFASNWSLGHVPIATEDVEIATGYTYYPNVNGTSFYHAYCNNLTIDAGTSLRIHNGDLDVAGETDIYGQLWVSHNDARLFLHGDVFCNSGSTANIPNDVVIWAYGDWNFNNGANFIMQSGIVDFAGSATSFIRCYDSDCSFNSLGTYKTGGAELGFSAASTQPLRIDSLFYIHTTGKFQSYNTTQPVIVKGNFYNNDAFFITNGTFIFDGTSQTLLFNDPGYFNNLTISPSSSLSLVGDLEVHGNMLIEQGTFYPGSNRIYLRGNWTNSAGPSAFSETGSRVVFENSSTHQYVIGNEDFDTLEVDMAAALRVNNAAYTVTCDHYEWTAGGIDVIAGTFTADDLLDNGLFGGFWLNPGGVINLTNSDGWVDLNCNLNIFGGTMNIYGGTSDSYWPYSTSATVNIDDGTLDFKNVGIYLYGGYTLTEDITGGRVRTVGSFFGTGRNDFHPAGGVFEFYGTGNQTINLGNNYFNDIEINKGVAADKGQDLDVFLTALPEGHDPARKTRGPSARANTITLADSLEVEDDLVITTGMLDVSASNFPVILKGDWTNNIGSGAFNERQGKTTFKGAGISRILTDETFYDLYEDKTNASFNALEVGSADGQGKDITVMRNLNILDGSLELNSPCTLQVAGDITIYEGAVLNANDVPDILIQLAGSWHNENLSGGFDAGSYSVLEMNAPGGETAIQIIRDNNLFNDIIVNSGSPYVRPSLNVGYGLIHARNIDVTEGSLKVAGKKVVVDQVLNVYGNLILDDAADSLLVRDILWKSGSTDNVITGKIIVSGSWTWENGTSASITSGNLVRFTGSETGFIYSYDPNTAFYNLDIDKGASSVWIYSASTQPVNIVHNMNVLPSSLFHVQFGDLDVDGTLDVQNGATMRLYSGGSVDLAGDFTLNGYVHLNGGGDFYVHGSFEEAATGNIYIQTSGSFVADKPYYSARALQYLRGTLTMTGGLFEVTYNHIYMVSTFVDNISGGTIRTGGSFIAVDNVFQPTGGTLELSTSTVPGTPYVDLNLGNWLINLVVNGNKTWLIGGSGASVLTVKQDITINSGGLNGSDDVVYLGDDWTNNAGSPGFIAGTGHVYLNGTSPSPEKQVIGGATTFYNLTNQNTSSVIELAGPITVSNNYNAGAGGSGCSTLITGTPVNINNQLILSSGWFALSSSAPTVTVNNFDQGGTVQVTNGYLDINNIVETALVGNYILYNGTIDIAQETTPGSYLDINADIHIFGGLMNLSGGNDISFWPVSGSHVFEMSNGTLQYETLGIYLANNNMAYNITGGMIRTVGDFTSSGIVNVFDPSGGKVELYGTSMAYIDLDAGCWFHDLTINKTGSYVEAGTDFPVKGELDVKSGTFYTGGHTITVGP